MQRVTGETLLPSGFVSARLNSVFIVFSVPLYQSCPALWSREHTHTVSLEAVVVIVILCACVCARARVCVRQFYALDSPQGINPEKSNQTVFISTDSHFSFISSDSQIFY